MDSDNREKEKAHILQTWVVVIKSGIMLFPSGDAEFDQMPPAKPGIGYVGLGLLLKIEKTLIYTAFSFFYTYGCLMQVGTIMPKAFSIYSRMSVVLLTLRK